MKKILVFLLGFVFSGYLFAGNDSEVSFIGFSKDGSYAAFERKGFIDGKGDIFSEIHILNVAKNTYAVGVISVICENDEKKNPADLVFKKAKKQLEKYGIQKQIKGQKIELSTEKPVVRIGKKDYQLLLKETPTSQKCEIEEDYSKLLELTLESGNKKIVLQKDKKVPASRGGCVFSYKTESAYVYLNSLVVIVLFKSPGFEGPNKNHLGISAKIK